MYYCIMVGQRAFSIFIKHNITYCLYNLDGQVTLNRLKYMISEKIGIPVYQFYIVCCGKILDTLDYINNDITIDDFNTNNVNKIEKDRTIYVYIHGSNRFYKKLAYFLYENRCKVIDMYREESENTDHNVLNLKINITRETYTQDN